ncbi:MAG: transposase [Acidobacteriaceae bacterium]|nr:transposase [Acidobacteriaceae bacterium]
MDLSRAVYSRDLKIAAMRALDAGATTGEIARKYEVSPRLLDRWRGEWRAKGDLAFPGIGRRGVSLLAMDDARRIAELERKIGQLTMENDFLKKALQHFRDHHPPAVVNGGDACLKKSNKRQRKAKP